jgi:hypothetical protein
VFEQEIDEMTAGKTGGARDQSRTSHVYSPRGFAPRTPRHFF